jgi:hypothetical protein
MTKCIIDFMAKKEQCAEDNYQNFNKPDLKNGDIVTYRNGVKGIVFLEFDIILSDELECYIPLKHITYNLLHTGNEDWDIVKVQRAKEIHQLIKSHWDWTPIVWERLETVEMTLAEVCKALGKNVKIVKE